MKRILLVAGVLFGLLISLPAPARAGGECTPEAGWGTLNRSFASQVVDLVNAHRRGIGLGELQVSPALTLSTEWKALHMARYGYLAHNDPAPPVSRDPFQRMRDCGYTYNAALAENLAVGQGSPQDVVQAWLNSDGHRHNIENPDYVVIGVGAGSRSGGGIYWAQNFGSYDDSDGGGLFEGWNLSSWQGAEVQGVQGIISAVDAEVGAGAWEAVAVFSNQWRVTYRSAPLAELNTLRRLRPGDDAWIYTR